MAKKTHLYSLGVYLAEHVINKHMPSLSCNQWTNKPVQVTWGEAKEYKRLHDEWFDKVCEEKYKTPYKKGTTGEELRKIDQDAYEASEEEWNKQMKYNYILKEKYLPHTLKVMVNYIDFSDPEANKEIMKGFKNTLWDCDYCEYSLNEEDIIFENETDRYGPGDKYSMTITYVTLKLDLTPPSSYTGDDWIEIKTPQEEV